MSFSCVADYSFKKLTDISPEFLAERGVSLLLLDLDNTIAPYGRAAPDEDAALWAEKMKRAGVTLFIVSNNRGAERADGFARSLGMDFIKRAKKPSPKGIINAMKLCGKTPGETALAGDQSFTDVLGAKRAGITAILVRPISLKNPLLLARYITELPWRAACKEKIGK